MTMPIKFDTLEYTRNLVDAGIPAADAEAHANALSQAMAEATVSPSELLLLRTDVLARIEILRTSFDAKIDAQSASINAKIDAQSALIDAKIDALRAEVNAKIDALRVEMKARLAGLYMLVGLTLLLQVATLIKLFA